MIELIVYMIQNGIVRTSLGPTSSKGSQEGAIVEEPSHLNPLWCYSRSLFPETQLTVLFLFLSLPVRTLLPPPCPTCCLPVHHCMA